jgi:hypothetical protein
VAGEERIISQGWSDLGEGAWSFDFAPIGAPGPDLPARVAHLVSLAMARGMNLESMRLTFAPSDTPPAVRRFLKRAGRGPQMKARWPEDRPVKRRKGKVGK